MALPRNAKMLPNTKLKSVGLNAVSCRPNEQSAPQSFCIGTLHVMRVKCSLITLRSVTQAVVANGRPEISSAAPPFWPTSTKHILLAADLVESAKGALLKLRELQMN